MQNLLPMFNLGLKSLHKKTIAFTTSKVSISTQRQIFSTHVLRNFFHPEWDLAHRSVTLEISTKLGSAQLSRLKSLLKNLPAKFLGLPMQSFGFHPVPSQICMRLWQLLNLATPSSLPHQLLVGMSLTIKVVLPVSIASTQSLPLSMKLATQLISTL